MTPAADGGRLPGSLHCRAGPHACVTLLALFPVVGNGLHEKLHSCLHS
jgi:hypothetical protein